MQSALVAARRAAKYGVDRGRPGLAGVPRAQNDPETVLTLHDGQSFPYAQHARPTRRAWCCPTRAP